MNSLNREELFTNKVEADDLRARCLFEMAHHGVPDHLVQFLDRVGHRKDRLAQGLRGVTAFRRLIHDEDDLVHFVSIIHTTELQKQKAGSRVSAAAGFQLDSSTIRPAIPRPCPPEARRRTAAASPRRNPGWRRAPALPPAPPVARTSAVAGAT